MNLLSHILLSAQAFLTSRTARQAAQMTVLRLIGLGIGAVAQIYAARQLGPEKLGISGMALAAVAQGSILVTLGANTLLIREYKEAKTDEERTSLISAAYTLRTIISVGLALLLLATLPWLWPYPQYLLATACVLPMIFLDSNSAFWILVAEERATHQYLAQVVSALITAFGIFLFISPASIAGSDMVATTSGLAIAFLLSWRMACGKVPKLSFNVPSASRLLSGTKWLFFSAVVTYGYSGLEQPLVGWLRSIEELGVYKAAWQISLALHPFFMMLPLLMYPKLIKWRSCSPETLWINQLRVLRWLLLLCVVCALTVWAVVPYLFPIVFGEAFYAGGIPSALLLTSKLVSLITGIFTWGLWASKRDGLVLSLIATTASLSIIANFIAIPRFGIAGAAVVNLGSELFIALSAAITSRVSQSRENQCL